MLGAERLQRAHRLIMSFICCIDLRSWQTVIQGILTGVLPLRLAFGMKLVFGQQPRRAPSRLRIILSLLGQGAISWRPRVVLTRPLITFGMIGASLEWVKPFSLIRARHWLVWNRINHRAALVREAGIHAALALILGRLLFSQSTFGIHAINLFCSVACRLNLFCYVSERMPRSSIGITTMGKK